MSKRSLVLCCFAVSCAASVQAQARAHDADARAGEELGARARTGAPVASTNPEDASAAGTRIEVEQHARALQSVAEVVREAPGARVRSSGGFGAFSGVALRGAGVEHTTVLFGDLPLNTADTGAFDLSLVPLEALEAVEVYRGGAPVWWSDGAIGGVVRLVPRSAQRTSLGGYAGAGSFGRFELGATSNAVSTRGARPALFSHVSYARADNDYAYVADRGTLFDTEQGEASADDEVRRQRNAQIDAGHGVAHAAVDVGGGRLDTVLHVHGRTEGVPGPLSSPTDDVRRQLVRALGAASWTKESIDARGERRYRFQALASGNHQRNRLSDADGELGTSRPAVTDDAWSRAYARVAASVALLPWLEPTLVLSAARDDFRPEDALAFSSPPRPSSRDTQAGALELRAHGALDATRLELRASARGQWTQSSIWVSRNREVDAFRQDDAEALATYRVAAVAAPTSALAFSASLATGARVPSMLELFGDRALQEANPELRSERSRGLDASVVLKGRADALRGSAELRGFALQVDDMIVYRRTAQSKVRPENVDEARVLGLELGARGEYGRHFNLSGSATAMHTRSQLATPLPLRPELQLAVRPELAFHPRGVDRAAVYAEVDYVSFVYVGSGTSSFLPGRAVLTLGGNLRLLQERMLLSVRGQNVLSEEVMDVLSRPLPGLNLLVSVSWEESL